jgi:alpha-N-arabinofuranosidase
MLHLGFRQIGKWIFFHHLGREVFLTPVTFGEDGWFTAGYNGTTIKCFDLVNIPVVVQNEKKLYTFDNTEWDKDWCYLRIPHKENYQLENNKVLLKGTEVTLDQADSPTFIGLRQKDFNAVITCNVHITDGEAGITLYMDENQHYDLALRKGTDGYEVVERLNIGDIKSVVKSVDMQKADNACLMIRANNTSYSFYVKAGGKEIYLGSAQTKYLSSEVAGGFTGVVIGLYAYGKDTGHCAEFTDFKCEYQ